jgi:L-malate glycosyltransferase
MDVDCLRITHVVRAKPPGELGGAETHILDLATGQLAAGHSVRVVLLGPAQIGDALRTRVPTVSMDSMSMAVWLRKLRAEIQENPPDVLHSHGYRADLIAACARRSGCGMSRWTSVVTVHGFIKTSPGLRLLTRLNEWTLRGADVVIAVSSAEADRLATLLRHPVLFVPNGVSPLEHTPRAAARAVLGIDPSRYAVGFIGRLSPEKRPDLFVDMAAIVAAQQPDVDFLVIGSGSLRNRMERRAAENRAHIMFTGLVPDAASLMSALDVLVCPSDTEGTPRAVIAAMLAAVPVVATRVGGLPDLIAAGRTGLLVEPGSAGSLAAAVIQLLRNRAAARVIGERARVDAASQFSAQHMADRVIEAYRSHPAARPPDRRAVAPVIGTQRWHR